MIYSPPMRIEIDFTRPDALRALRQELEMALATVTRALEVYDQAAPARELSPAAPPPAPAPVALARDPGPWFDALPGEFTSGQAIAAGVAQNLSAATIRRSLADGVQRGQLELARSGSGRRPSVYRKR